MRTVPTSNGLEWESDGSCYLDAIPSTGRRDTPMALEEIMIAVLSGGMVWRTWHPAMSQTHDLRQFAGVMGIQTAVGVVLRYIHKRGTHAVDGLYAIEAGDNLPPAIAAAVLSAVAAQPLPEPPTVANAAPMILARIVDDGGEGGGRPQPRMGRNDIERAVGDYLRQFVAGEEPALHAAGVNRARILLALAQRLWTPETLTAVGAVERLDRLYDLNSLAVLWHELRPATTYRVGKADIQPPAVTRGSAWQEALSWSVRRIPADAARFFAGFRATDESWDLTLQLPQVDPQRADAVANGLLREARERQVYSASGQFALALPDHLPWRTAGIVALAIHAQADGLWVAGLTARSERTASWWWQPEMSTETTLQHTLTPLGLVHATLAAFWHDLVVAGDEVIVQAGGRARLGTAASRDGNRSRRGAGNPVVTLPRRSVHYTGHREWGTAEDREIVTRRSHGVRGHLRQLPDRWSRSTEAEGEAREWGFVLPDGYTFVRPHVRGGHDHDPAPVIAKARGLQTLSALL